MNGEQETGCSGGCPSISMVQGAVLCPIIEPSEWHCLNSCSHPVAALIMCASRPKVLKRCLVVLPMME
jgi:hypothetical protein